MGYAIVINLFQSNVFIALLFERAVCVGFTIVWHSDMRVIVNIELIFF